MPHSLKLLMVKIFEWVILLFQGEIFVGTSKSAKIFTLEDFRQYGILADVLLTIQLRAMSASEKLLSINYPEICTI